MGYYGRSSYRGDFRRRGGFHPVMRGDFLDDLGGVLGKVGGYIDKGLEYTPIVGKVVKAYDQVFSKTVAPAHPAMGSPQVGGGGLPALPSLPNGGAIQMVKQRGYSGGTSPAQRREDLNDSPPRRRMNVCNGKALRRALRRADGFLRFAKHYVKVIKPGHHVELKAHHHKHKK